MAKPKTLRRKPGPRLNMVRCEGNNESPQSSDDRRSMTVNPSGPVRTPKCQSEPERSEVLRNDCVRSDPQFGLDNNWERT